MITLKCFCEEEHQIETNWEFDSAHPEILGICPSCQEGMREIQAEANRNIMECDSIDSLYRSTGWKLGDEP